MKQYRAQLLAEGAMKLRSGAAARKSQRHQALSPALAEGILTAKYELEDHLPLDHSGSSSLTIMLGMSLHKFPLQYSEASENVSCKTPGAHRSLRISERFEAASLDALHDHIHQLLPKSQLVDAPDICGRV